MESRPLETCSLSVSFALWTLNTREVFTSVTSSQLYVKGRGCPHFYAYRRLPLEEEDCAVCFLAGWGAALCVTPSPVFPIPSLSRPGFFIRPAFWWKRGSSYLAATSITRSGLRASFWSFGNWYTGNLCGTVSSFGITKLIYILCYGNFLSFQIM
jgi:hypothetical protein